jgi:hypothetical protein
MVLKRVGGGIGGAKHFDIKALEEAARGEFGGSQFFGKGIKQPVRVRGAGLFVHTKNGCEFIRQPDTTGCPAEEMKVFAEDAPDFAVVAFSPPLPFRERGQG